MQQHLYTTEQHWRALFHGTLDGIAVVDNNGTFVDVNHAACTIFGVAAHEIVGRHIGDFQIRQMFAARGPTSGECVIRRPDGSQRIVQYNSSAQVLPGVHLGILRDVTEQKKSEESLRELTAILDSTEDAIYSWNREGRIVSWNRGAEKVYGYLAQEVLGKSIMLLVPRDRHREGLELLTQLEEGKGIQQFETVRLRKDGQAVHVSLTISPIRAKHGEINGGSVISRDISQRRLLEEQLRQAQKMEAIGHLAGGVAHDFNNLLTVINGYCEILLRSGSLHGNNNSFLLQIRDAGERAASLTRQLLAFSRKQVVSPVVLDVNAIVTEMDRMLRRLIGADIELSTRLDPDLGQVKADRGQVEQVIMNLVVNARDAMPHGGQLAITTDNVVLDEEYCQRAPEMRPGRHVRLTVSDTGHGMDRATQARIFEPFFTTKEVGKGTGLGLATVYGIVRQNKGSVSVVSEVGRGTTFCVHFPCLDIGESFPGETLEEFVNGGVETILIAEDDEAVRHLLSISLEAYGYQVIHAADGAEAMAALASHPEPIDLVISDVVMPRMDGCQLAREISTRFPSIRLLLMSGYPGGATVPGDNTPFLQKPFTFTTLARKVREILDAPARERTS